MLIRLTIEKERKAPADLRRADAPHPNWDATASNPAYATARLHRSRLKRTLAVDIEMARLGQAR